MFTQVFFKCCCSELNNSLWRSPGCFLTCSKGRAHHKEHSDCNPLQWGWQQAIPLQNGVHQLVLQGYEDQDKHCIKHGQPGCWKLQGERTQVGNLIFRSWFLLLFYQKKRFWLNTLIWNKQCTDRYCEKSSKCLKAEENIQLFRFSLHLVAHTSVSSVLIWQN